MGLRSIVRAFLQRKKNEEIKEYLEADQDLAEIIYPFSKGWAFQAASFGGIENVFQHTEEKLSASQFERIYTKDASSYWIRTGSKNFPNLDHFVAKILPFQTKPFTLISSDGDLTVPVDANPASVEKVLGHPKLLNWYSQNADITGIQSKKLKQIPIGLDLHTPRPDGIGSDLFEKFVSVANMPGTFEGRSDRIFVDIHLNYSDDLRREVSELISGNPNFSFLDGRVPQFELWRSYRAHKYILSTIGNGYDCHRTWEALGLGCRVVTITSPMDALLKNFPVYIARSKEELASPDLPLKLNRYFTSSKHLNSDIKFSDFIET